MYLSDSQKEIVKAIADDRIRTVKDFIKMVDHVEEVESQLTEKMTSQGIKIVGTGDFSLDNTPFKVTDENATYEKLIDFKKVINILAKANLIEISQSANLGISYLGIEERPKRVIDFINSNRTILVIPYNELEKFAEDFRTPEERYQRKQLWIPILVAVLTVLLSSIANYLIYSNEREVYITNEGAFKDTVFVKIESISDSLKVPTNFPNE